MSDKQKTWGSGFHELCEAVGLAIVILAIVFGATQCRKCQRDYPVEPPPSAKD